MSESTLTDLQLLVLELFFKLPEADGFVLAGGAALVASGLTERPTQDIDLFGSDVATGITAAADALEVACTERGWTTERIRNTATFRRLIVRRPGDELLVDLAVDSPPLGAPTITTVGPTYPPRELAAR
jgi:predicted nucleotidyltransferase